MIARVLTAAMAVVLAVAFAGCLKVTKEDGKTKVEPGSVEIKHVDNSSQ